jgi:hypothetical protein
LVQEEPVVLHRSPERLDHGVGEPRTGGQRWKMSRERSGKWLASVA